MDISVIIGKNGKDVRNTTIYVAMYVNISMNAKRN